ncbi:hypothetical protein FRC12_010360 [Ceratobasidium sp. 428]|nr:hypothetical protein FRC12_010360 [Ceratobasidium sp. 428]
MSFNLAYTESFPEGTKITKEQIFEALRHKARDPSKFVPAIVGCEVLEETPTSIKSIVTAKNGTIIQEEVTFYPPCMVMYRGDNGSMIMNSIAEDKEGRLSLTYSFSWPVLQNLAPGSEAEITKKQEWYGIGKQAVEESISTTLKMFEAGKLL